ncbi:hypothetical protein ACLEPN_06390 [Myxococcus sp. 1LA]
MRPDIFIENTLSRCEALKATRLWHGEPLIRPRAWLNNFKPPDQLVAAAILNQFTFISDFHANKMLTAAFERLIEQTTSTHTHIKDRETSLKSFLSNAVFTRTEGENPNPTDSGNIYCRKARQVLAIPESSIKEPYDALQSARAGQPVVFIDDFIGSGNQLIETWERQYLNTQPSSFAEAFAANPFPVHYLCTVATAYGISRIHQKAPDINIHCAHTLDKTYSIRNIDDNLNITGLSPLSGKIEDFLERTSKELILPTYMQQGTNFKYGYHNLSLTLAFEHSVPDATLPVIWAQSTDPKWIQLCPRR